MLFGISTAFFFCTSTAAAGMVCSGDSTGRYAAPLVLALPFLFGAVFTAIVLSLQQRAERQQESADNGTSEVPRSTSATMVLRRRLTLGMQIGLSALLCIYLCAQVSTYTLTDAGSTFNSPSVPGLQLMMHGSSPICSMSMCTMPGHQTGSAF